MKKILIEAILLTLIFQIRVSAQQTITLKQAIAIALKNNPSIKIGSEQIKNAEAKSIQAHSSFLPQISTINKYFYTNNLPGMYPLEGVYVPVFNGGVQTGDNIIMHPMAPFPSLDRDVFTSDFNVVYPIYVGGKRVNASKAMDKLKDAYKMNLEESKASLIYKVKVVYYNNIFLKQVISVYQKVLKQLNMHLGLAEKAYKEGVRSQFDILNFENKIQEFKTKIVEMEGNKKIAEIALKNLLSMPQDKELVCTGDLQEFNISAILPSESQMTENINQGNYKMQGLKLKEQVLLQKKKIIEAGKAPVLFSFGNFHINHGKDFPPFDDTWRTGYAVGIGLKINIFDGNLTKGKTMEIQSNIDKVKDYQEGLSLQLRFSVAKSVARLNSLKSQKKSAEINFDVAQKAYDIAKIGYKNGVNTAIELNDAQLNILKVNMQLLKNEKDILITQAKLKYLKGSNN